MRVAGQFDSDRHVRHDLEYSSNEAEDQPASLTKGWVDDAEAES